MNIQCTAHSIESHDKRNRERRVECSLSVSSVRSTVLRINQWDLNIYEGGVVCVYVCA